MESKLNAEDRVNFSFNPRDIDWSITYHNQDKNPFGAYALDNFIQSLFPKASIHKSNYTLYELYDTLTQPVNFFSISTTFEPGKEDTEALLKNIELGGNAFIAAQYFSGPFADTLSLNTSDYFFETTHDRDRLTRNGSASGESPRITPNPPETGGLILSLPNFFWTHFR